MKLNFTEIIKYLKTNHILSEDIDLSNTHLSDEEVLQLAEALLGNTTIRRLNLSNCNLSDNNVSCIISALKGNETLTEINLSGNENIADEGLCAIAECLKTSPISKLYLSNENISSSGLHKFVDDKICNGFTLLTKSLENSTSIRELNLTGNSLREKQFNELANVIIKTQTLQILKLTISFTISSYEIRSYWKALAESTTLKQLAIKGDLFRPLDRDYLADVLKENKTLRFISVTVSADYDNKILTALIENNTLTHLKLNLGSFNDSLSKMINKLLATNKTLESLSIHILHKIPISDLIAGLKKNQTLKSLDISNSKFTGDFIKFFDFLATNTSLTELNISKISLNSLSHRQVTDCLRRNKMLKRLTAQSCCYSTHYEIRSYADQLFLKALDQNHTLEYLDISQNRISSPKILPHHDTIPKNKTLKELNLSSSNCEDAAFPLLLKTLTNLSSLTHLNLSDIHLIYDDFSYTRPKIIDDLTTLITNSKSLQQLDISIHNLKWYPSLGYTPSASLEGDKNQINLDTNTNLTQLHLKKGIDTEKNSMAPLSTILFHNQCLYLKQYDLWQYILTLLWLIENDLTSLFSKKDDDKLQDQLVEKCQSIQDALDQLKTHNKVEKDRLQRFEHAFNSVLAKLYFFTNNIQKAIPYLWEAQEDPEVRYLLARLLFLYPESLSLDDNEDNFRLILILLQDITELDLPFRKRIDYEPNLERLKGIAHQFLSEKKLSMVTHDRTLVPMTETIRVISLNKLWDLFKEGDDNVPRLIIFQNQKNWRKTFDVGGIQDLLIYEDLVLNAHSSRLHESLHDLAARYHQEKLRLMTLLEEKIKVITETENDQTKLVSKFHELEQKQEIVEISEQPEKTSQLHDQTLPLTPNSYLKTLPEPMRINPQNYLWALQQDIFDKNHHWKIRHCGINVFLKDNSGKEIPNTTRTVTRGMEKILDQIENAYNKANDNPGKTDEIWEEALLNVYTTIKSHGHHWQWINTLFIGQDPKTKKWYNETQKEMEDTFGQLLQSSFPTHKTTMMLSKT